ncbi:sodium channel modifier 1 [Halyomorpha halys]|uniref:sodium channel modifier 1 n=1 Tax=Halyomorpha halys TaxID=286706 RepID=UPI0006D525E7|nr:sodium channel modifier 1-like [Halyomorpha halys]
MSFKREGDDLSLLNKLKHQRVSEMLGNHIPEDEAKLLSNGRFTCLICLHRPIFDTVAMLGKHRKGKKHLLELSRYIKHKLELEYEALKKQQLDAVKALSEEMTIQSIICSRTIGGRDHHIEYGRRKTLDIPIFKHKKPGLLPTVSVTSPSQSSASQVRRYLKTLHRKRSLESIVEKRRENYGQLTTEQNTSVNEIKEVPVNVEPLKENVNKRSKSLPPNTELSLNLSGWIKDKDGNWVKDVNAEFDSDDESPPELKI